MIFFCSAWLWLSGVVGQLAESLSGPAVQDAGSRGFGSQAVGCFGSGPL